MKILTSKKQSEILKTIVSCQSMLCNYDIPAEVFDQLIDNLSFIAMEIGRKSDIDLVMQVLETEMNKKGLQWLKS